MKVLDGSLLCIDEFPKDILISEIIEYGIVILRNFSVDVEKFSQFIGKTCSRVTNDPARKASTENAQLIEAGDMEMGLHLENGNAPFMPDLQFFYCEKAPIEKSRTTYCDGYYAYKMLDSKIAQYLHERQIMYTRDIIEQRWKKYFSVELQRNIESISDLLDIIPPNVQIIEKENHAMQWRVRRNVVFKSKLSNKDVLAHCIYGPSLNYEIPNVTWSDGSMINPNILNIICEICDELTKPIPYQDGDVVIIDNHRVMHGREQIVDMKRKIYGGQGYL